MVPPYFQDAESIFYLHLLHFHRFRGAKGDRYKGERSPGPLLRLILTTLKQRMRSRYFGNPWWQACEGACQRPSRGRDGLHSSCHHVVAHQESVLQAFTNACRCRCNGPVNGTGLVRCFLLTVLVVTVLVFVGGR